MKASNKIIVPPPPATRCWRDHFCLSTLATLAINSCNHKQKTMRPVVEQQPPLPALRNAWPACSACRRVHAFWIGWSTQGARTPASHSGLIRHLDFAVFPWRLAFYRGCTVCILYASFPRRKSHKFPGSTLIAAPCGRFCPARACNHRSNSCAPAGGIAGS